MPGPATFAVVEADDGLLTVIDPVVVHEENTNPELGVADIESDPASSHTFVPDGLVVPSPEGLTAKDTWYWVSYEPVTVSVAETVRGEVTFTPVLINCLPETLLETVV